MSKFDRAIKEIMQNIFLQSSRSWLGIDLTGATLEELNPKISRVMDREADFLKKVSHLDLGSFILHLEFQTQDDRKMHYRMAEYRALLQRSFELPVRQYVIYLGRRRSKMITTLPETFQIVGYQLLELNRFKTEQILSSNLPDEIILAILTDYPTKDAKALVGKIIERLKSLELSP